MIGVKLAEHSEVWKSLTRDIRWGQHWQTPRAGFRAQGRIQDFFRRGCTRLLLYFNTNEPHSFFLFCRIPVVLENRRSCQGRGGGGGGAHPLHPPPPPRSVPEAGANDTWNPAFFIQSKLAVRTPLYYGQFSITDSFQCPDKILIYFLWHANNRLKSSKT